MSGRLSAPGTSRQPGVFVGESVRLKRVAFVGRRGCFWKGVGTNLYLVLPAAAGGQHLLELEHGVNERRCVIVAPWATCDFVISQAHTEKVRAVLVRNHADVLALRVRVDIIGHL